MKKAFYTVLKRRKKLLQRKDLLKDCMKNTMPQGLQCKGVNIMYGKFDKYDLFEACKTAQEIYNETIQDGMKSRWGKDKAETGYILLRTIIASHGLDEEYEAWHNSQIGNAAADFVLRCTK